MALDGARGRQLVRAHPSRRALIVGAAALAAAPSRAQAFQPGLIFAVGQRFDRSFNQSAHEGSERFQRASGLTVLEFEPRAPAQFEQGVAALARRGATDIVAVGFYYATPLAGLARQHPAIRFTLIDAVVDAPNVRSVTFREQEGAYLAGVLAALASRSGTIGFVAAIDIPLIRRFTAGYEAGARRARPDIRVLLNFVGTTPDAFNDPPRAAEVAGSQIDRGADVIFAGAGISNLGIFQRAVERRVLAIGVDANQNGLHPGTILTSQLKRVDVAVERAFVEGRVGAWRPGPLELGLAEGGVALAFDEHNAPLISPAMRAAVAAAQADVVAGRVRVPSS